MSLMPFVHEKVVNHLAADQGAVALIRYRCS